MAVFLTTPAAQGSRATPGERRLGARLSELLEDDYLCWYDVPVGSRYMHPDFVLLHPARGLLVLEVKDWRVESIREINPTSFTVDFGAGHKQMQNPLAQVRQYAQAIAGLMERDPQLVNAPDGAHAGRLVFPYGYGVVLTAITRKQFEGAGLDQVMPAHLVICRDEMTESADAEEFQKRLWDMFTVRFLSKLTLPQVERIRWNLFPELRIEQGKLPLQVPNNTGVPTGDVLPMMDLAQEVIARNLGDGHRVIHGVAGSGKTLILGYRCRQLAETMQKPILVLVYNKTLAAWLQQQMELQGISDRVMVRNFHAWCRDQLQLYHVPEPTAQGEDYFAGLVEAVIRGVDLGQIPRAQYGALLIDEGHDFAPDWLRLVVQMIDPETNSLLLLYDDAQSIYSQNRPKSFSFRSVGISAAGRTRILKKNYRNTNEILACAHAFARELLSEVSADEDGVPLVSPEPGGRSGPPPRFARLRTLKDEAVFIADEVQRLRSRGLAWKDIGIFYTAPFVAEELSHALLGKDVPLDWLKGAASKAHSATRDAVKLMTPHSSKGLQFRAAIIAGLGLWPFKSEQDEARLLYVAMTRATHELILTSSKSSAFSNRLAGLCEPIAA